MKVKEHLKQFWNFFWHSDSIWSWLLNIVVAFVLIKFVIYPLFGLMLGTGYPIVAVISESMEHGLSSQQLCGQQFISYKESFNNYWDVCGKWYENKNISSTQFQDFPFKNGFDKGDIILVLGKKPKNIEVGDVLIFQAGKPQPIIHRVIKKWEQNGVYYFQTKGDHNSDTISTFLGEHEINQQRILGTGVIRIPYLGWVKILFVQLVSPLGITITK